MAPSHSKPPLKTSFQVDWKLETGFCASHHHHSAAAMEKLLPQNRSNASTVNASGWILRVELGKLFSFDGRTSRLKEKTKRCSFAIMSLWWFYFPIKLLQCLRLKVRKSPDKSNFPAILLRNQHVLLQLVKADNKLPYGNRRSLKSSPAHKKRAEITFEYSNRN